MSILEENETNNLRLQVLERIEFGEDLISSSQQYKNVEGIQKLQRKISQELKFLKQIVANGKVKKEHVQCTNLTHFSAVLDTLQNVTNLLNVCKVVLLGDRKITIDIICDNGLTWTKVIARNPKSLSQVCMGDASYGVRSVFDQAEDYIEAAKLNPCLFQIPKIVFVFANGVGDNLATKIESMGITVQGNRLSDVDIEESEETFPKLQKTVSSPLTKVNLDVSAMLAYVSSVCNGSAGLFEFPEGVLAQQAQWERERPQKPVLDEFFKNKELYCCETARDSFLSIVHTVGGPTEQRRCEEFLKRVKVLPDDATSNNINQLSAKTLTAGGKIKDRSLTIFRFGDRIGAVTATSNDGFVRAARQQGVNFVVFVHESRALTEQKEQTRAINRL